MDSTKSFVKVYNITPDVAEDFEFDFTVDSSDLLTELVPNLSLWGDIGWMELEEYEYNSHDNTMHFILDTKWEPPTRWLQPMSADTMDAEEVANYYDDDKLEYELDDLDNQIWDSIGQFVGVCEKFYANGPVV